MNTAASEPAYGIPKHVITAMVTAGASNWEIREEDMCVVQIDSVESHAWKVYETWVSSLPSAHSNRNHKTRGPIIQMHFSPPTTVERSRTSATSAMIGDVLHDVNLIRYGMALMDMEALKKVRHIGFEMFPFIQDCDITMMRMRHPHIAVTALLRMMSNPGVAFEAIDELPFGYYICHVQYTWKGAIVMVPIFRTPYTTLFANDIEHRHSNMS
jgi:hypothetical protein